MVMPLWHQRAERLLTLIGELVDETDSPSERFVLKGIAENVRRDLLGEKMQDETVGDWLAR